MSAARITKTPRSVPDATRFTPTIPHAASKPAAAAMAAARAPPSSVTASSAVNSRFQAKGPGASPPAGGAPGGGRAPGPAGETPQQRVARLRAAHNAAKNAQVSRFDQIVDGSRGFFDKLHRFTALSLIGFTAIAGLVTVYAMFDMMAFNKKRKVEFIQAQIALEADSLEAARLAYMRNEATPEQIELVEEANARGETSLSNLFQQITPLGAPTPVDAEGQRESAAAAPAVQSTAAATGEAGEEKKSVSWAAATKGFFFGGLKEEDTAGRAGRAAADSDSARLSVADQARAAFEKEKENQQKGGPLDRIGTEQAPGSTDEKPPRKGWW